jgi:hypothetical protein
MPALFRFALLGVLLVVAAGCRDGEVAPPAHPPSQPPPLEAPVDPENAVDVPGQPLFDGMTQPTEVGATIETPAVLVDVRTAVRQGYDRVVFEFADDRIPGYELEFVEQPVRDCASDRRVEVDGSHVLLLRLTPARASTVEGEQPRPAMQELDRRADHEIVRHIVLSCDHEGEVHWAVGHEGPGSYRVMELAAPARLLVDLRRR